MYSSITIRIPVWLDRILAWPVMVYRRYKYGFPFRRIPLGEGIYTIVDPDDYYRFGHMKWCLGAHRAKPYAVCGVRQKDGSIKTVGLHRIIKNPGKGRVVDHKNGDSLDNRSANLRSATHAQNTYNRKKRKNATSKYIGVSFSNWSRIWDVQIKHKGKQIWLGRFKREIDGARAYDRAALKLRGRFARLNFPPKELIVPCLPRRVFGLRD
ncbi:MAG: AP2/ERF family transcription factor [Sedimentisphaerales bacterium]